MRNLLIAFCCCFVAQIGFGQIGFTGAYFSQSIPEWERAVFGDRSNDRLLNTGYSAEIDFKITPFENYRVEFFPAFNYNLTNSTSFGRTGTSIETFDLTQYDFSVKTNIFFLSLEADCDCPTFSREAGLLEKGLFVQVAPGVSFFNGVVEETNINPLVTEDSGLAFKLGFGLGLEIGLADFLTVTPIVKYNRYFGVEWEGLTEDLSQLPLASDVGNDISSINQFYGGIKLGIRFRN